MSNSIWHKYDIKDIPNPHHEILAWTGSKHAVVIIKPVEWRSGDCDWIESWAYIQDIIAQAEKAEQLQKGLEDIKNQLEYRACLECKHCNQQLNAIEILKDIEQLIKETTNDK